jgi:hypothetical protein
MAHIRHRLIQTFGLILASIAVGRSPSATVTNACSQCSKDGTLCQGAYPSGFTSCFINKGKTCEVDGIWCGS